MSCDIIEPGYVQIDGSDYYLGGAIGGATFNLSDISSQSTADITLYEAGSSLTTPSQGSSVTVTVMDYTWTMTVSKYSFSSSAKGATQLKVTLTDTSHWYLDQDFIVLNEEFPANNINTNCHAVGGKYGPLPEDELLPNYIMTPNRDTKYGHLRAWFTTLKVGLVVDPDSGNAPLPKLLTADDVDTLTETTPGKSMYWTNESSPYADDTFYGYDGEEIEIDVGVADSNWGGDKSLYDILGEDDLDLLGESCYETREDGTFETDAEGKKTSLFPNMEMQEVGSLRSVMTSFANKLGWMCYWDMENEKIELVSSINTADGNEKLNIIQDTCFVTASSSSSDFTTTSWEGAVGSVTSSNPGQNQSTGGRGGKQSRFLTATLLKPEFTYRNCSNPLEGKAKGSFRGPRNTLPTPYVEYKADDKKAAQAKILEVGEAIAVALASTADNDVWAHFVAEEILKANINNRKSIVDSSKWGGLSNCADITAAIDAAPDPPAAVMSRNSFIADYYMDSTAVSPDLPCSTDLFAIKVNTDAEEGKALNAKMASLFGINGEDGKKPRNEEVFNVAGKWDSVRGGFEYGTLCGYVKKNKQMLLNDADGNPMASPVDAIMGEGGFINGVDALRPYLRAIGTFFSRYYVVQSGGLNTARTAKFGRDYGYYVAGSSSLSGAGFYAPGFNIITLKPFHALSTCNNKTISELARALAQSYCTNLGHGGAPSVEELLDNITIIDFIYALDNTRIPSQAGTNSVSTETDPVNGTSGADKVNPPRKDNLEELFVDGTNRFSSKTEDSLRTGDEEPQLKMFLLERQKFVAPVDSIVQPSTIVSGGITVTQEVHKPEGDPADIAFLNTAINKDFSPRLDSDGKIACNQPTLHDMEDADEDGNADNNYDCIDTEGARGDPKKNGCPQPENPFWCCQRGAMVTNKVNFFVISNDRPWPIGENARKLNFFQGRRSPEYLEREAGQERMWYNLEGVQGPFVNNDAGSFYLCEGSIPEEDTAAYWKGSLNMGISLDAADISLTNTMAMEYGSSEGSASAYSAANKVLMRASLKAKVANQVAKHGAVGSSNTVSIIVGNKMEYEDPDSGKTKDLELPTWKEGLESISISSTQGKTVVGITIGNKLLMRAVKAALDLRSSTSTFQHQQTKHVADSFRNSIGQGFYNKAT